jgi:peroxiredoxin
LKKQSEDLGPAPEFEALDVEGKPLKLSDYRGRVVVLVLMRGFA